MRTVTYTCDLCSKSFRDNCGWAVEINGDREPVLQRLGSALHYKHICNKCLRALKPQLEVMREADLRYDI